MLRYAIRRLITSLATLFLVITITFFLMQAVPGNPFYDEHTNPEAAQRLLKKYGYDQPVMVQYVKYMGSLLQGYMGESIKEKQGKAVTDVIGESFPTSLKLGGLALLFSIGIGIPLGALAAMKHGSIYDRLFIFFASFFVSIPSFITTVALMMVFAVWLQILPVAYLTDWKSYIMPVASMALGQIFSLGRLTRTSMLDAIGQDYIKTARAKGLSTFTVIFKHAMRNAIIPVVTALGPMIAGILTGSFVVEKVFGIKGIGKYFISSISTRDYPMIMGVTIVFAALLILCNYIVDLLYGIIDPRIKM